MSAHCDDKGYKENIKMAEFLSAQDKRTHYCGTLGDETDDTLDAPPMVISPN